MRKLINYIVLIIMALMLPTVANAASATVGLSCPSAASSGETISCNVTVSSDVKVNGLVANYSFTGASFVSFTPSSGFTSNYTSATGFNIGYNAGKSGSYRVGVLKVKVNSAATIILKNIDISDTNFNSYSSANRTATIRIKSTNTNLGSLSLTGGTLSPSFKANTTSYTSSIDASSVTINATKGESTQIITGTGKKSLNYGKNTFKVVVKSEAGTSKSYTIVITRLDKRNSDNYLKSLSLDKGSISFKKETLTYSVKVAKDVSLIKVSAVVNASTASFVKSYGPRTVNLNYGVNNVLIKVKAENETIRTYTIKVTREDDRSSDNNLSSITLSSGNISFSKDVTDYNVSVPYNVTKIDVVATAEDSKSNVKVTSPDLIVGNNKIMITVTAENGQSKIYVINVKRLEEQAVLSNNNSVSLIDIKGHKIEFKQDINEYDVSIGDEYALVIDVLLEDSSAKYVIEGNEDLKDGSVIKIVSTSESGQTKEYKLNIKKNKTSKSGSGNVFVGGLIGFVLGLLTMFIVTSLLKKNKSKKVVLASVGSTTSVKKNVKASAPVAAAPIQDQAPLAAAKPVTTKTSATTSVSTSSSKPAMQEANVSQPTSKEINVIPGSK